MFRRVRQLLTRLLAQWPGPEEAPPDDPYAGVRHPRRGGPAGKSSAIAVAEPEPDRVVEARGPQQRLGIRD
jgi:hypothetical protein